MGFVGSGIHFRISHILSKSSRNWFEKKQPAATKIKSEQDASPAFFVSYLAKTFFGGFDIYS